jgi:pre-rRNA-processing protein TSR3
MRSSGSTRSPRRDGSIRLWLVVTGEDHSRACTGRRLIARGLVREIASPREAGPGAVVLDPHAPIPLSPVDRPAALRSGVVAIDCSWNRLADRGGIPPSARGTHGAGHRRLPFLLATNPQHFGRLAELNTAEAVGAALYVLGAPARAAELLEGFAGGAAFLRINHERLDRYARAPDPRAIVAAEAALFGPAPA